MCNDTFTSLPMKINISMIIYKEGNYDIKYMHKSRKKYWKTFLNTP